MGSTKVFFRTHIDIIMVHIIKYSINCCNRRDANRTRRKTTIFIGVIWIIYRKPLLINTMSSEILSSKLHSWVGLERHVEVQTVDIHTRNLWHFSLIIRLLIHNTCECNYLTLSKSSLLSLLFTFEIPELLILFTHLIEELIDRSIPIKVVRIRNKHCWDSLWRKAIFLANLF